MVISVKSGRRGRIRPQRPLIASSQIDEAPARVPPTRRLRDYVNPIIDASTETVPTESNSVPDLVPETRSQRDEEDPRVDASPEAVPTEGIEVPDLVPETRSLRDEEDPRVDDSREAVPAVGVEESIQTAQHDVTEGDNNTGMVCKLMAIYLDMYCNALLLQFKQGKLPFVLTDSFILFIVTVPPIKK